MRFAILGTTRAWRADGGEVAIGGRALRMPLTLLLSRAGEAVSVDSLVEDLYGERPALDAGHALQSQISRLRRTLTEVTIDSLPTGYRLVIGDHQIDVTEFERLSEQGRQALAADEPRHAAELLRDGIALWRGAALADVAGARRSATGLHQRSVRRRGLGDATAAGFDGYGTGPVLRVGEQVQDEQLVTRPDRSDRRRRILPVVAVGMGTGLAVVGAYVLAGELATAGGDHAAAFARYESAIGPMWRVARSSPTRSA